MAKKLIYVGFPFKHHKGTHAGYYHIKDTGIYNEIIDCTHEIEFPNKCSKNKLTWFFFRVYRKIVGEGTPITVLHCIFISLFSRNNIFHFIHSENTYKWLAKFKGKTNKIVLTVHQPASWFENHPIWINRIKEADKIILLSTDEEEKFKQWTGKDNVDFIPHGIFTDFYKPDINIPHERMILMVGNWLRDFETANKVFKILLKQDTNLHINVVTLPVNEKYFDRNERLHFLHGISDEDLRDLYRRSSMLFLPIKEYTANNAVLEAAATGCRIVVATNHANMSYFSEDQIIVLSLDVNIIVDELSKLLETPCDIIKQAELRDFVVNNYSWSSIGKRTKNIVLCNINYFIQK
ncbi:MAG TPA: glycosyltransferase [Candidatus Enterocola sp.]|jgi:glycosyltransferase involved in cell wall biosynthesis|nr:glycosyltransferase [Candidatus Enterocola sp.]